MRKVTFVGIAAVIAFGLTPSAPATAQDINSCMRQYNADLAVCGQSSQCMQFAALKYGDCLSQLAEKNE